MLSQKFVVAVSEMFTELQFFTNWFRKETRSECIVTGNVPLLGHVANDTMAPVVLRSRLQEPMHCDTPLDLWNDGRVSKLARWSLACVWCVL